MHLELFTLASLLTTKLYAQAASASTYTTNEHVVTYNDGANQIAYLTQGPPDGELLIFLHGWPAVAETWKHQLDYFAGQGYYTVAPDMPGYGNSSFDGPLEDYSHERIITGLLALLEDTGRDDAIWIGHDWGAAVASSLVATHPEVVKAMAWLTVPYKTIELGYVEVLPLVNRTIYPESEYPYGQWEYMVYYEEAYERATAVFNSSIDFSIKALYGVDEDPASAIGKPGPLSEVRRNGGWFGGVDQLPSGEDIPVNTTSLDQDLYETMLSKFSITGFGPADAYYMNHERNRAFNLEQQKNDGYVMVPCLFIEAQYDSTLDTYVSDLLSPMPPYCENFSFASVNASHWVQLEQPGQVNEAVSAWLNDTVIGSPSHGHGRPESYDGDWGSW